MDNRLALAVKYYQSNLDDQAWVLVSELMAEPSPSVDVLRLAATLSYECRELEDAIGYCDKVLAADPDDVHAFILKGRALSDMGCHADAAPYLEKAVALDNEMAEAHYNLGRVRHTVGNLSGAISSYRAAVERQDPYPVAWNNLGLVLERAGDGEAAAHAFATAIDQFPEFSAAHNNLGALLAEGGQFHAAQNAYVKATEVDPGNLDAMVNFGVAKLECGEHDSAIETFENVLIHQPSHSAALDNRLYTDVYRIDDELQLRAKHCAAGDEVAADAVTVSSQEVLDPDKRLRVGFLSPDFRRHSVSSFSLPLIQTLDRTAIEVVLVADVADEDAVTQEFRLAADEWFSIAGSNDEDARQAIQDLKLDCIVDLAGRTNGNRLKVLATRVASLQVMALGYPAATGLPAMDYWLCDSVTNPKNYGERYDRDRPLRLVRGLHVFAPSSAAPDVHPLPALVTGHVTFGSFNKLAKISNTTMTLWASVLKALPTSRLFLKARALADSQTVEKTLASFESAGVARSRIEIQGWAEDDRNHLNTYNQVDIALDTTPYNGTTTTCEALWMGVPVLSLCGSSHAARVGASILTSANMTDCICYSPSDFVEKARSIAGDLSVLSVRRETQRAHLEASALLDREAAARAFEQALRSVWDAFCAEHNR